ncbi:MAG: tRNA 2-thiouridine(34) synthase MnmA [Lentisphaerae bacterium]|nr:tRNA 2-thiouridine(34) synthase MnmA [Lentisphaerota bacterium]
MKIAVLISGGVDSSVALRLLKTDGEHTLTAFYLKIWLEDELAGLGECPWEDDLRYVRQVCDDAGVPLRIMSLQSEYRERIVAFAVSELAAGRTPSPDIQCNERIKYGAFLERLPDAATFDKVATGHYARVEQRGDRYALLRAPDPVKDQTYFLSRLSQPQLARALFPIGHLHKHEVRALARDYGLPNQARPDSQGICFLGNIKFADFVRVHLGERPGDIVDAASGRILGQHNGCWFYTIGQRQGLRLGGGPWYVQRKDLAANTVYVTHADAIGAAARREFEVEDLHWIRVVPVAERLQVRLRHGPALPDCRIVPLPGGRWRVTLDDADPGIAAGQSAVFYDGEECLGAGTIC